MNRKKSESAQNQRVHLESEQRKRNTANLIKWDIKREADIMAYKHINEKTSERVRM